MQYCGGRNLDIVLVLCIESGVNYRRSFQIFWCVKAIPVFNGHEPITLAVCSDTTRHDGAVMIVCLKDLTNSRSSHPLLRFYSLRVYSAVSVTVGERKQQ